MKIPHIGRMTVAAHRGDSYNQYENTMTAFRAALAAGTDMIELDVHLSRDGVAVIMHDHTVDRTTDGMGAIADKTLSELKALNAGSPDAPETVPTLEEFMAWAAEVNIPLNLELKEYYSPENEARCVACIEAVIAEVEKYGLRERVVLNSFDAWVLEYVYKKYGKTYMLHGFYPYSVMKNVSIDPTEYLYCACVMGRIEKAKYDFLLAHGIEPWIGASITQKAKLAQCLSYGARLVTTNNPKDAIEKLTELHAR